MPNLLRDVNAKPVKKYAVYGGEVISKSDGDKHRLTARRVAELYEVNPDECVFIESDERAVFCSRGRTKPLIELHPRYDGSYSLPHS